jgi:hypothetical protein
MLIETNSQRASWVTRLRISICNRTHNGIRQAKTQNERAQERNVNEFKFPFLDPRNRKRTTVLIGSVRPRLASSPAAMAGSPCRMSDEKLKRKKLREVIDYELNAVNGSTLVERPIQSHCSSSNNNFIKTKSFKYSAEHQLSEHFQRLTMKLRRAFLLINQVRPFRFFRLVLS